MLKCPSKRSTCIGLTIFFIGGVSFGGFNLFFDYTNRTEFCLSCHSMQTNYDEYKRTAHFKNKAGVGASCADCHVPRAFFPKFYSKIVAAKDVFYELTGSIDSEEKFAARRWLLANRVWDNMRATDSRECRSCHDYTSMDHDKQDKLTLNKHKQAPMRGKTCIDCHSGIAHEEPLMPG